MSHLVSAISRLHDGQLAAATKVQDVFIKGARKLGTVGGKTPDVPERVAGPLRKVTAPLSGVIGSRSELATLLKKNAREWTELQMNYQAAILDALAGDKAEAAEAAAVPLRPKADKA
jgi:hypothetical protein